jgi:hypothetical protein
MVFSTIRATDWLYRYGFPLVRTAQLLVASKSNAASSASCAMGTYIRGVTGLRRSPSGMSSTTPMISLGGWLPMTRRRPIGS